MLLLTSSHLAAALAKYFVYIHVIHVRLEDSLRGAEHGDPVSGTVALPA
jgi:hypothetical protein